VPLVVGEQLLQTRLPAAGGLSRDEWLRLE
jgi:hypothetical protein